MLIVRISTGICSPNRLQFFDVVLDLLKLFFAFLLSLQFIPLFSQENYLMAVMAIGRVWSSLLPLLVLFFHCFHESVQFVQKDVREDWRDHASYNVAKKVVEFEYQEEIPRSRLRAAYGDGFKGAPLRCQSSGEGPFPQDAGRGDGATNQILTIHSQEVPCSGGSRHV